MAAAEGKLLELDTVRQEAMHMRYGIGDLEAQDVEKYFPTFQGPFQNKWNISTE